MCASSTKRPSMRWRGRVCGRRAGRRGVDRFGARGVRQGQAGTAIHGRFGASRHRRGAAQPDAAGSSQRPRALRSETLARVGTSADASVTVRADSGFFSYDMIRPSAPAARPTGSHSAKVKAAEAIGDDAWKAIAYTRGGEAQVARPPSARRRGDKLRGDDANAKLRLIAAACSAPASAQLALPRSPTETSQRRRAYHRNHATVEPPSETSLRAQPLPLGTAPTAPGSPAAWRTSPAGRPASGAPSQLTVAATIRRLLTVPGRLATATDCACRSTGHGHTPVTTALQQIRNRPLI